MMRIVLCLLLVTGDAVRGSPVYRHEVKHGSDLEKELGYKVLVQDENDEKRSKSPDKVIPIKGAAPRYMVEFRATEVDKLKDLFELDLTLGDANGMLVQGTVELESIRNREKEVDGQFIYARVCYNK